MSRALQSFDVHASVYPASGFGALLETIEAASHRAAKAAAANAYPGQAVVVLPHRTPNPAIERLTLRKRFVPSVARGQG